MDDETEAMLRTMLTRSGSRARKARLAHALGRDDPRALWQAQTGRCPVSDIAFSAGRVAGALVPRPVAPSLDRIYSAKGYELGNVRLVSIAANFALGQWGDAILLRLARGIVETERRQFIAPAAECGGN